MTPPMTPAGWVVLQFGDMSMRVAVDRIGGYTVSEAGGSWVEWKYTNEPGQRCQQNPEQIDALITAAATQHIVATVTPEMVARATAHIMTLRGQGKLTHKNINLEAMANEILSAALLTTTPPTQ